MLGRVDEIEDRVRGAEVADHAVEAAFALARPQPRRAASARCRPASRAWPAAPPWRVRGLPCLGDDSPRRASHSGSSGRRPASASSPKVKMPCLSRIRPSTDGSCVEDFGRRLGEVEARHDVGHEAQRLAEHLRGRSARCPPGRRWPGSRSNACGRRICAAGRRAAASRPTDWARTGSIRLARCSATMSSSESFVSLRALSSGAELDRRQALRLDDAHVPAAALDAEHVPFVADEIGGLGLDRGVAAAMQHEARIAAEQPRRVDAQRQVAADALLRHSRRPAFRLRRRSTGSSCSSSSDCSCLRETECRDADDNAPAQIGRLGCLALVGPAWSSSRRAIARADHEMRAEPAGEGREQRLELAVLLHDHQTLRNGAQRRRDRPR